MPRVTLNIPAEKMALFMDTLAALGLYNDEDFVTGEIPDWHKKTLDERLEEHRSGKAEYITWEELKKVLDNDGLE